MQRVQTAARELGYRPNLLARSLSKKSTRIIGLVADELKNPHIFTLLDEVTRQLQSRGYMALLLNITSEHDYESVLTLADQMQVDGLLFLGTLLNDRLISLAQDIHRIPLVVLYRYSESPYIQVLATHGYQAGFDIGELLLQQDYPRMGYLAGPISESTQLRRLDGFRAALAQQQREVNLVLQAPHYQRLCGMEAFSTYLAATPAEQRIDAIFARTTFWRSALSMPYAPSRAVRRLPWWALTTLSWRPPQLPANHLPPADAAADSRWHSLPDAGLRTRRTTAVYRRIDRPAITSKTTLRRREIGSLLLRSLCQLSTIGLCLLFAVFTIAASAVHRSSTATGCFPTPNALPLTGSRYARKR